MNTNQTQHSPNPPKQTAQVRELDEVMAQRKSCSADGVGLSHYILMDRKSK